MKIYLATHTKPYDCIQQALESISDLFNLTVYRADLFNMNEPILSQIIEGIKKADLVIADISNENPNVFYEIGIAHAANKPVIILSQSDNFNKFSLLLNRFYKYDKSSDGIKNLSFYLKQVIRNPNEIEELKPLRVKNKILDFNEVNYSDNRLGQILQLTGVNRYREFENWIYELLIEIPGWDVQHSARQRDVEYDFIVWNSTGDRELEGLGNPIPIELKATKTIQNSLIHSLASKAILQGFKSFILITTAELLTSNENLIRNLKSHSGMSILVIGIRELEKIQNSKDMFETIKKSHRQYFTY